MKTAAVAMTFAYERCWRIRSPRPGRLPCRASHATVRPATSFSQRSFTDETRGRLGEALDELERGVGDLAPAAVDRQRVSAVRDLLDLGHALVALLPLERRVGDRPGDGVVLLAVDDQQRPAVGVLRVRLRLRGG